MGGWFVRGASVNVCACGASQKIARGPQPVSPAFNRIAATAAADV